MIDEPETALLAAMMMIAIQDATRPIPRHRDGQRSEVATKTMQQRNDAREWLMSDRQDEWSARWVCSHLGIHLETLRKILAEERFDLHLRLHDMRLLSDDVRQRQSSRKNPRIDHIVERSAEGMPRGEIAREVGMKTIEVYNIQRRERIAIAKRKSEAA